MTHHTVEDVFAKLQKIFPDIKESEEKIKNYPTWSVSSGSLFKICETLKKESGFEYLDMVTAVDRHGKVNSAGYLTEPNPCVYSQNPSVVPSQSPAPGAGFFEIIIILTSFSMNQKLILVSRVDRTNPEAESLYPLFKSADWQEREVFDLFGIKFTGHPNLKKILTPDFIKGHPLRKDYVHKKDKFDY
ncbi:MAG: NADH-quinone oxidoreductase subunit C [Elusimicrobia bacterium]|nr:NADH-quinone oxidoreductase subunit C [Elusimicrobiota bacterium]